MKDTPERPNRPTAESAPSPAVAARKPITWKTFLTPRWLLALAIASLVGHGLVYAVVRSTLHQSAAEMGEVSLGSYQFVAANAPPGAVRAASFELHVGLLDPASRGTRGKLAVHRYLLRQTVEELLRQAHPQDFADPSLAELKRQLLEKLNETLGARGLRDVIITDLVLERDRWDAVAEENAARYTASP